MRLCCFVLSFVLALTAFAAPKPAKTKFVRYLATEILPASKDFAQRTVSGLNDRGEIAGNAFRADNSSAPFVVDASGALILLPFSVQDQPTARAIGAWGDVVGDNIAAGEVRRAFRWNSASGLTVMSLGQSSYGNSANSLGDAAGEYFIANQARGYLWDRFGNVQDLGTLDESVTAATHAYGVNSYQQVVGEANGSDGFGHAFVWSSDAGLRLLFAGAQNSVAYAINDRGQVAGSQQTKQGWKAYIYSLDTGAATTFAALTPKGMTFAQAINDQGVAVGQSDGKAAIFQEGVTVDLNTLTAVPVGWVLTFATGINNNGQIVVNATSAGKQGAFLLTPVQ
jgi:uncharacterized membrane protein